MNLNPNTHVILTFPLIPKMVLRQQGADIPLRSIICDNKTGAPRGVRLAAPYDDVVLVHGSVITDALRARMRDAIAQYEA